MPRDAGSGLGVLEFGVSGFEVLGFWGFGCWGSVVLGVFCLAGLGAVLSIVWVVL